MRRFVALAFLIPCAASAHAVSNCGNQTGITVEVASSNDSVDHRRIISLQSAIDTTWVFHVAQKTWPLGHMEAAIKADVSNSEGTSHICSGVMLSMEQATLTVKGARGTVHFKASLEDLKKQR